MLPVAGAYLAICATWWLARYMAGDRWTDEETPQTGHKWLDLAMVLVGILGVFLLGQAYRAGFHLPELPGSWRYLTVTINLCIPFLPIFVILFVRQQSLSTLWISGQQFSWKILAGIVSALTGLAIYLTLGNEWSRLADIAADSLTLHSLAHALPVFLEGVAIAFIFVRLRWVAPAWVAVLIPCVLFAAAHIPRFTETEQGIGELVVFLAFNTAVAAMVFSTALRARDIIWIAIPHYVMDIAIRAFH